MHGDPQHIVAVVPAAFWPVSLPAFLLSVWILEKGTGQGGDSVGSLTGFSRDVPPERPLDNDEPDRTFPDSESGETNQ